MRSSRGFPAVFAILGVLAVLAAPPGAQRTVAQVATPVGAPIPGSVPCTTLFGTLWATHACWFSMAPRR
jgi:hypothetical protein